MEIKNHSCSYVPPMEENGGFCKHTKLAIMAVLASETLLHENKISNVKTKNSATWGPQLFGSDALLAELLSLPHGHASFVPTKSKIQVVQEQETT